MQVLYEHVWGGGGFQKEILILLMWLGGAWGLEV